jgi:hypothetical protein
MFSAVFCERAKPDGETYGSSLGKGWAGDSVEREWADCTLKAIEDKAALVPKYKGITSCVS